MDIESKGDEELALLARAARETEERARKIAEAAESGNTKKAKWEELFGLASFGPVEEQVEKQIHDRMIDIRVWERQARGLQILTAWMNSLSEDDRSAVMLAIREADR